MIFEADAIVSDSVQMSLVSYGLCSTIDRIARVVGSPRNTDH